MTVVYVALPSIVDDLDARLDAVQWVVDAYAVVLAASLLTLGALADRIGRRRVFVAGLAGFTAASSVCALAWSPLVLDLGRALQGLGGAAVLATSLALLAAAFPPHERGRAFGVWGAVTGAALAAGPFVGGVLVELLGWRAIFWLNVPVGAALLLAGWRTLVESRDPGAPPADWPGALLSGLAVLAFVAGLIRGDADGWTSPGVAAALAAGVLLGAAFVVHERRSPSPMLAPALFRDRSFSGVALVAFAQSVALYPVFLLVALFLQRGLGRSALEAGLLLMPATVVILVLAPLSGRLVGRLPVRAPLSAGLLVIAAGLLVTRAGADAASSAGALLPGIALAGAGIGIISPALAAAMIGVLSPERAGLAAGVGNTFRQLGIAAGVAVLGTLFRHGVDDAAGSAQAALAPGLDLALLVAAAVALVAVPLTWALVRLPAASASRP